MSHFSNNEQEMDPSRGGNARLDSRMANRVLCL